MAWHTNEALTDLSIFPDLLNVWQADITDKQLEDFLTASGINTDSIENDDIPDEYEGSIYKYLAYDIKLLMKDLGLISPDNTLSHLGQAIGNNNIELYDGLSAALSLNWQDENQVLFGLLDLLRRIRDDNLPPCSGLILVEACVALKALNNGLTVAKCYETIKKTVKTLNQILEKM